jgi:hypothetical protein
MMAGFAPMAFELRTERLVLSMWEESDAAWHRQLVRELWRSPGYLVAGRAARRA